MKLKIDWWLENETATQMSNEIIGTFEFESTQENMDKIQNVVDHWELNDVTIDQGGDDDFHELNLCDVYTDDPEPALARRLLKDVEAALAHTGN